MKFEKVYRYINPNTYINIFSKPHWYLEIQPELKEFFYDYDGIRDNKSTKWLDTRSEYVTMICEFLKANQILLASFGDDLDNDRLPIDAIVIHHSSTPPDSSIDVINTLGLIRLYAPYYSQRKNKEFGQPIWSNHTYKNRQTFVAYHYIVRQDGTFEHILQDAQIGWHCGDWNHNCRSIAICFLDDLKKVPPTRQALQTAKKIIRTYPHCKLLGHREVKLSTLCPGSLFLGNEGWKNILL
ncbi:hypothetical protein COY16_01605 [Candidatus Roizmanbacteria bacterium CG_4_10_14_0_2_um_filter_39_13]|uniref:Peptidoglycan recognition protein family domain-containing protein n=1 Tax=Candidatus Roizmanbacteria bacterium CG_4_10_14_0_2_um_filter_39_13 TaxID=1974825 RepID=A0A2M7U0E5_9BACT|nr:MAG: hypothetical protein COY16_01605 [Candidatus Roizmanbacteria bacterium CG_4_10_14_0_2_um_filter_39_13]